MYFNHAILALVLSSGWAAAQSNTLMSPSTLALRQAGPDPLPASCNATCATYQDMTAKCITPHCGCRVAFLQAEGDCLLCQANSSLGAANVQILLDAEINQCHSEKIMVEFQLDLAPEAEAIVQKFNQDSASLRRQQTAFLAFQIAGGHIGMVVILTSSLFSFRVHRRNISFLNFCITWMFSSVAFSILLYRGTEGNTIASPLGEVSRIRCAMQAALAEGAQVMTAGSTLALVMQLWLDLRAATRGDPSHGNRYTRWMTYTLNMMPYTLFIIFAIPSAIVGADHVLVDNFNVFAAAPSNFYCAMIGIHSFLGAVYGVTFGLLIITVAFDALIISIIYRQWRALRHIQIQNTVSLSVLLRAVVFSTYRIVVAVAYGAVLNRLPKFEIRGKLIFLNVNIPMWADMLQAAIPLVGFLVFGVTKDAINLFMFWRSPYMTKVNWKSYKWQRSINVPSEMVKPETDAIHLTSSGTIVL